MTEKTVNVLRKSNVYPRCKGSMWADVEYLKKIEDVKLLGLLYDEFKKGDPNRSLRTMFSDEQIALMKSNITCEFAPAGVKTYGYTQTADGRKKLVCRCPYAADPAKKAICGAAWDECNACYAAVQYNPEDFAPVVIPSQVNVPVEPPVPPSLGPEVVPPPQPVIEKPVPVESTPVEVPAQATEILFPENLDLSYGGFEIVGVKVVDGYEVRITSGGAFVANVTCNGVAWGNHSKLAVKRDGEIDEVSFGGSQVMKLSMNRSSVYCVEISIGDLNLRIPVK